MKQVRDFRFKQFTVSQHGSTHKVGTDGVLLGAWVSVLNCSTILDIGTGTGVIALMLAQRTAPEVTIDAVEIQAQDAEQARENVNRSPWPQRVIVHEVAIQNFVSEEQYDLIVSNPPFFVNSSLPPSENRTTVRHTANLSFDDLLQSVTRYLAPTGLFALILPVTEALVFRDKAKIAGLNLTRQCEFRSRAHKPVERILMEYKKTEAALVSEQLVLYDEGEAWSQPYQQLTKAFYLKI